MSRSEGEDLADTVGDQLFAEIRTDERGIIPQGRWQACRYTRPPPKEQVNRRWVRTF